MGGTDGKADSLSAGICKAAGMGIFAGAFYESVQQQEHSFMEYRKAGRLLLYVHQSCRVLAA